jgi:hypothetical protein
MPSVMVIVVLLSVMAPGTDGLTRTPIEIPVAAAASVPFSLTLITDLWMAYREKILLASDKILVEL